MKIRSTRFLNIAIVIVCVLGAAWYQFGGHRAPAGQPPLTTVNAASVDLLKAEFNQRADRPRIILLLSPT